MQVIESMPTYLGKQYYQCDVLPFPADMVYVNGRSIEQIFLDTCDGDFGEEDPNIKALNDYYRYYILAPCWDLGKITPEEVMNADSVKLFDICMEMGIDPI